MKTIGSFFELLGWFKIENSLAGFSNSFLREADVKYKAVLEAIGKQFGVTTKGINDLPKTAILTGETLAAFNEFEALINRAREARSRW